jgi:hypothetical protein
MPQITVKGIYRNGVITPLEGIPYQDEKPVLIVFLDEPQPEEADGKVEKFLSNLTSVPVVPEHLVGCANSGKKDISSNKYKYLGKIK